MMLFCALFVAALLVTLGYLGLWTAARAGTPSGLASFGRILAIILLCLAALSLLAPVAALPMRLAGAGGKPGGCGAFGLMPGCCGKQDGPRCGRRGDAGGSDIYSDEFEDRVLDIIEEYEEEEDDEEEPGEELLPE